MRSDENGRYWWQNHAQCRLATTMHNDNNDIYGVNTSLLRKNTQLYMKSSSSPSLKNIFTRSAKASGKDLNNNSHYKH